MNRSKLTAAALAAAAAVMCSCSASTKVVHDQVTVTATATATATAVVTTTPTVVRTIATRTHTRTITYTPPPPKQYGEGTYVVGTEIKPGLYHTDGGSTCYWARLSGFDPIDDIIANSPSSGPQTVEIMPSDKAFTVDGDCTFGRSG